MPAGRFLDLDGRQIEKRLRAIDNLPNSQIAAIGLLLAEGRVDSRKLDVVKKEAAKRKMSKRRILAFALRRYGKGVLRSELPALDRIRLLLRG